MCLWKVFSKLSNPQMKNNKSIYHRQKSNPEEKSSRNKALTGEFIYL